MIRTDVVNQCIKTCGFQSYLEIGCKKNETFDKVDVQRKCGVDSIEGGTVRMISDDFFAINQEKFDIIFIDGDHRCRQVFRDITNSFTCLNEGGIIISHDCNPPNKQYESTQNIKCGDAWKTFVHFRQDPNIDAIVCDCDFGVGVLRRGLNCAPVILDKPYYELTWEDFVNNRQRWLALSKPEEFVNWLKRV
jgi:hypothetical protein